MVVAEKAELDIVVSGAAYDVVPARADFVQEVGCAWGDVADWSGDGVGAADADGFVHVAHDGRCGVYGIFGYVESRQLALNAAQD